MVAESPLRGTNLIVLLNILRGLVVEVPADRLILDSVHRGDSHCVLGWCFVDKRKVIYHLPGRLEDSIDPKEHHALFGLNTCIHEKGASLKAKVIRNIDRIIEGKPPLPYDSGEWWAELRPVDDALIVAEDVPAVAAKPKPSWLWWRK